jgi:hypothetical protein
MTISLNQWAQLASGCVKNMLALTCTDILIQVNKYTAGVHVKLSPFGQRCRTPLAIHPWTKHTSAAASQSCGCGLRLHSSVPRVSKRLRVTFITSMASARL